MNVFWMVYCFACGSFFAATIDDKVISIAISILWVAVSLLVIKWWKEAT